MESRKQIFICFFSLSASLTTKFHNHGKKNTFIKEGKKSCGVLRFLTQHLRFLKAYKALSCFPKEEGMSSPHSQIKRLQNLLHVVMSMFINVNPWSFSFEEGNGASQLHFLTGKSL